MAEHPYLSEAEQISIQDLKQDAIRLTKRNDTILKVVTRLEEALKENEKLKDEIIELSQQLGSID